MRKLQTQDVFKFARIIKEAGMKEEIVLATQKAQSAGKGLKGDAAIKAREAAQEEIGVEILMSVLENCSSDKMEAKVYDFLAGVFEMTADEIKVMSLDTLIENVKRMVRENNFKNFLSTAGRMEIK